MKYLISLVLFICFACTSTFAQWLCPWGKRTPVAIQENNSTTLTNYQVRFDISFQPEMNADFSDLRFTSNNGTTLLDYWVEYSVSSSSAIVWVKIPSIPASGTANIFMYYDNASANTLSNAVNTFLFFDDFSNWSGWNNYGAGGVTQNTTTFPGINALSKITSCDPNGGYKNIGQTISQFRLITREIRSEDGIAGCAWNRYGIENGNYNGYTIRRQADVGNSGQFGLERRNGGSASNVNDKPFVQPRDIWYRTELRFCDADANNISAYLYQDDRSLIGSATGTDKTYNSFDRITIRGGHAYFVDFMAVAKYICNEPTYTFGSNETIPQPIAICKDVTVSLDAIGTATVSTEDIDSESTYPCGLKSLSLNKTAFNCEDLGNNVVVLTVTDLAANTATCNASVVVVDNIAPSITCPSDIIINAHQNNCTAIVNWTEPSPTDNCKIDGQKSSHNSGDTFPLGTTTVTHQVADISGNKNACTFTVTVNNPITPPSITVTESSGNSDDDDTICKGGNATFSADAGYANYTWSSGQTSQTISVSDENNYSVTVSDNIGCTDTASKNITVLSLPTAGTCNVVHDQCLESKGKLTIKANNGLAPYQVSRSPSVGNSTSNTITNNTDSLNITNIPGGTTLSIVVTDANGCSTN